jgi:hypothetical protein
VIARKRRWWDLWLVLSWVVSAAWAASFVAPLLVASYKPDGSVNSAFLVVVGALAGAHVAKAERRGQRHDSDDTKGPTP